MCLTACGDARPRFVDTQARGTSAAPERTPSAPYHTVDMALAARGSIEGKVLLEGDAPDDSTVTVTADTARCGSSFPDSSVVRDDRALGAAVVWLADIGTGKLLPAERRSEIVNRSCRLEPRVQGVVVGTTVNVRNDDRVRHTTLFIRGADNDTLARVPLTDDGQVVPNERIAARPGLIEVRCTRHPWMRGYIAVLANPYFAVTQPNGVFRFDSIPPGRYRLQIWHERAAESAGREVEVRAGEVSGLELQVKLK